MLVAGRKIISTRFRKPLTRSFRKKWRVTRGSYRPIIIVSATYTLHLLKLVDAKNKIQICCTNHRRYRSSMLTHVIPKSRQPPLQVHIFSKLAEVHIHLRLTKTKQKLHINQPPKKPSRNPSAAPLPASRNKTLRQVKQDKSLPKSVSQQQMPTSLCWTKITWVIRPCCQSL